MTVSRPRRRILQSFIPVSTAAALGSLGLLSACGGGKDAPPGTAEDKLKITPPSDRVDEVDDIKNRLASNLIEFTEANQADTFRNVNLIHTTRPIARSRGPVLPLDRYFYRDLDDMRYPFADETRDIDDFMQQNRTAGLLILKDGRIALERYGMGHTVTDKWTSFSLTKSFMASLAGAAVRDGKLRLSARVQDYLDPIKAGPYADVTIENLLRMRSGIGKPGAPIESLDALANVLAAGLNLNGKRGDVLAAIQEQVRPLPRDVGPPQFRYSTLDSIVLGEVVHAATGRLLSDYLQEKIWEPAGMESDGYWLSESPDGLEMGGAGISATLRDFGRFGQFILSGAQQRGRGSLLPENWAEQAYISGPGGSGGSFVPAFEESNEGYGYQWWVTNQRDTARPATARPIFYASGLMGQRIYIDPISNVVAVILRALPLFDWTAGQREQENLAMLNTAIRALQ